MELHSIAISIIVGAFIGYFTNWLAIKMLFRPLFEKRILGIHIPFTPGIIPKRRHRLAVSFGDTVGNFLLSQEQLQSILLNEKVSHKFSRMLHQFIHEKLNSPLPLKTVLANSLNKSEKKLENYLHSLSQLAIQKIKQPEVIEALVYFISKETSTILDWPVNKTVSIKNIQYVLKKNRNILNDFIVNKQIKNTFYGLLEERISNFINSKENISSIVPKQILDSIEERFETILSTLIKYLTAYLKTPEVHQLLAKHIENFFEQNFFRQALGSFMRFLGNDKNDIAKIIINETVEFLEDPKNQHNIILNLSGKLKNNLHTLTIYDITSNLNVKQKEELTKQIILLIYNRLIQEENLDKPEKVLERLYINNSHKTWEELLIYLGINKPKTVLSQFIRRKIEHVILQNNNFDKKIYGYIYNTGIGILNTSVVSLVQKIGIKDLSGLEKNILGLYQSWVKKYSPTIINTLNIKEIIEKRINELELLQVEKLILNIVKKEFTAITWLGAFLGGIIGLVMPLLNLFLT